MMAKTTNNSMRVNPRLRFIARAQECLSQNPTTLKAKTVPCRKKRRNPLFRNQLLLIDS